MVALSYLIAGANLQAGVYGTQGVAAAANVPAGRSGAAGWMFACERRMDLAWRFQHLRCHFEMNDLWVYPIQ